MPTSIKDIVEHRAEMLRDTLRDTPKLVLVALDAAQVRQAIAEEDADPHTEEGYKAFKTRLRLNSREWKNFQEKDIPQILQLGRRRITNVVVAKGSTPHKATCWVRDGYSGYRSAYAAFVKKIYGAVDFDGFKEMEIDHLVAKGQKRSGGKYIRIEAINKSVNRSHGATVDKSQAKQKGRSRRDQDNLTIISVLKLYGLKAPRSRNDGERLEEIRKKLKANGWDAKEAMKSIDNLLRLYAHNMD